MHKDWNRSQPPYNPDHHSTKEIEHRFTALEEFTDESKDDRSDIHKTLSKHSEKLTFHERVLLGLAITIGTLLQDKFPAFAATLASIVKAILGK